MNNWNFVSTKVCEERDRRRQHIIDLLKHGEMSVADIQRKLSQYKSKTIANDLSIMAGMDDPMVVSRHTSNGNGRVANYRLTRLSTVKMEKIDTRLAAFTGYATRHPSKGKVFIADEHEELFREIAKSQKYANRCFTGIASNHSVLEMAA